MRRAKRFPHGMLVFAAVLASLGGAAWGEEAARPPLRQFCAAAPAGIAALAGRSVRSVTEFGAVGDGVADDTAALQRAFDRVGSGAILEFPPGTYLYSRVLTLARDDIVLRGDHATLQARNPEAQALVFKGDRTAALWLTLRGAARTRLGTPESAQMVVKGRWVQLVGNTVSAGASAGIFVFGGQDFRIVGNRVHGTLADGIHMTEGARRGLVEGNVVYGTGDDMIAVVSYRPSVLSADNRGLAGDILIENNDVSGNSWGRGITVVGGEHVAITRNRVSQVWGAAGIYVAQESSFKTYGNTNIYIGGNSVSAIQTAAPPLGRWYSRHGAIDINTSNEAPVQFIDVEHNTIDSVGFSGIRVLGTVCHLRLADNALTAVQKHAGGSPIGVVEDSCAPEAIRCRGNTLDGHAIAPAGQCVEAGTDDEEWRGAKLSAAPQGATWQACAAR
ncbi:MAG TPA: right-handed parallel beta-helix repeat-containing protein [Patescibacteria group bacterium]|nr:right-handed parallel beta-helix repeat-containing protein [Patescibacteria group bacterium]